ncbi:MAG: hypothetical protein H7124_15665 [Phycisphaerales bacterium]|nr:hypothetical protein [Hyphomonadaceae bacterium]
MSHSIETDHLSRLAEGRRAVFYDELAQYGPRYIESESVRPMSVDAECRYHVNNLILLSMYFDVVFIQTAAIFNVNDLFLRRVIQRTISHPTFKGMLRTGSLRICGWGGKSPIEMFSNAWDFANVGATSRLSDGYGAALKTLFCPEHLTYRIQDGSEDELAGFLARLRETPIINNPRDVARIERAIDLSNRQLGELAAMSFFPHLQASPMDPGARALVYASYANSWCDYLNNAVPGVYVYMSAFDANAMQHNILIDGKALRSFLFSPRIFAAFLQKYFSVAELNRILSRPYEDIHNLRNGDWKRFCEAYHAAVEMISDSISSMDFGMLQMMGMEDQIVWGSRIWEGANKKGGDFDLSAFLQSLASISGIFLAIPILGPVIHVAGVVIGRRINKYCQRLIHEHGSKTSPYIRKVRMNLALQVTTA